MVKSHSETCTPVCVTRWLEWHNGWFQKRDADLESATTLKNNKQFVGSLKGLRVRDGDYCIKFNIQDYCMSGNKDDLVEDALDTFEGDEKRLLKEALYLLLEEKMDHVQRVP